MVRDGQIVARPMMYLALTYDHRLIDGTRGGHLPGADEGSARRPDPPADRPVTTVTVSVIPAQAGIRTGPV